MKLTRRGGVALLAMLQLAGCTYWQPQLVGPREALADPEVGRVRLTRPNGDVIVARVAEVRGDTIYGSLGSEGSLTCERASEACSLRMPISQVGFVELRSFSAIKTAALVLVPVGVFVVIVAANSCSSGPAGGPC